VDERWMQAVAAEFNTPITAFLVRSGPTGAGGGGGAAGCGAAQFRIRWFTPIREVIVSVTNLPLPCFRIC
jgi:predicted PhzF superfamily epimerase YddE/YHI9